MENEVVSKNFIEQIIDKDLAEGKCDTCLYPLSSGAERIPSYRTCQIYSFELWAGTEVSTVNSTCGLTIRIPTKGED